MKGVPLQALRPSHPLAYLAALGLQRLVALRADEHAKLAWEGASTLCAWLHTKLTKDQVLDALEAEWNAQANRGTPCLIERDGMPVSLPPKAHVTIEEKYKRDENGAIKLSRRGEPQLLDGLADPSKLLPEEFSILATAVRADPGESWLRAIGTDVRIEKESSLPTITRSQFYLLSRQQTFSQQCDSLLCRIRIGEEERFRRHLLQEAIDGWRRYEMTGGMNWDIGANQNAAESPIGDSRMMLVPGAVWLAINALPLFPVSVRRRKVCTRGWQEIENRSTFIMPVWRRPLDILAIEVLLDHPLLGETLSKKKKNLCDALTTLGVSAVYCTRVVERRVANQTERYLDVAGRVHLDIRLTGKSPDIRVSRAG